MRDDPVGIDIGHVEGRGDARQRGELIHCVPLPVAKVPMRPFRACYESRQGRSTAGAAMATSAFAAQYLDLQAALYRTRRCVRAASASTKCARHSMSRRAPRARPRCAARSMMADRAMPARSLSHRHRRRRHIHQGGADRQRDARGGRPLLGADHSRRTPRGVANGVVEVFRKVLADSSVAPATWSSSPTARRRPPTRCWRATWRPWACSAWPATRRRMLAENQGRVAPSSWHRPQLADRPIVSLSPTA